LYIADFYNSIIGHYEVPLTHPKRDKIRGRIWRITHKGEHNDLKDLTSASLNELIAALDADNLVIRMAAGDQLADRIGAPAINPVKDLISNKNVSGRAYIHALWVLHRLNGLSDDLIIKSAGHQDAVVRVHSMRILAEKEPLDHSFFELVSKSLEDKDPHVKRAATELLAKFSTLSSFKLALAERDDVPEHDTHQLYTTRLVLRNLLRNNSLMKEVVANAWNEEEANYIVDVLLGVPSADAAIFLAGHLKGTTVQGERLSRLYEHLARYIPQQQLPEITTSARSGNSKNVDAEYIAFKGIQQWIARRGGNESSQLQGWGTELAMALFQKYPPESDSKLPEDIARQKFAADLAGKYKIRTLELALLTFLSEGSSADPEVKVSALRSLLILNTDKHAIIAGRIFKDTVTSQFKKNVASLLADFSGPVVNKVLGDVTNAPPDLQSQIVMSLAGSPEGKNIIFTKVRKGELLPRTLLEPKVEERLLLNISKKQQEELSAITANLEPISKERQTLIDTWLIDFSSITEPLSLDSGNMVFSNNCAPCHTIGREGGSIGPQLDGVGKWGSRALAEKILDPNRNVSEAFRNYTITLKDGKVLSGLYRRDEGEVTVFADLSGKEFSVPKNTIAEQKISRYTLMPDHFRTVLSQEEFNALLKYLLSLQS